MFMVNLTCLHIFKISNLLRYKLYLTKYMTFPRLYAHTHLHTTTGWSAFSH